MTSNGFGVPTGSWLMYCSVTAIGALAFVVTGWSQNTFAPSHDEREAREMRDLLRKIGGRQEARTPDLRVANAALSQLS